MNARRGRTMTAAIAVATVAASLLAGCGGDDAADGPVTLEYWGWAGGLETVVAKFNETHDDIQINFTKGPGGAESVTNLRNAAQAGNAPCLAQGIAQDLVSFIADGVVQDVTEWMKPHQADYSPVTYDAVSINDKVYAVPQSGVTGFVVYNMEVLEKHDVAIPATWDEYVEAGRKLSAEGIKITNLAGEDPSTLVNLAWQAGARWYEIDGESWRINFLSPESLEAAAVVQGLVDADAIASISYADYAAVMQNFDNGDTVSRPISTWQLSGMEKNFTKSLGQWKPAPTPTFGADPLANTGIAGTIMVPTDCENPEQAVEAAHWLTTNAESVGVMASPTEGAAFFPSVADPAPYIETLIPQKVMGDYRAEAPPIILDGSKSAVQGWKFGPNFTAMFEELADGWAKVVTKEQTVQQLLEHIQAWTVEDLKSRGVTVAAG